MQLRYKYRLYPTSGQRQALAQTFGNACVVFNDAIAARRAAYQAGEKMPSAAALQRRVITQAKKTPQRAWLSRCSNIVLQ